ncbi:hypothetical protein AB0M43_33525 [Longispora sp. NPDC051575]|uniref:hypothetical protein n=1 Tax=Longispora sp. NPDC051575 TaxID=3154943 RepID=UPI00342047A2
MFDAAVTTARFDPREGLYHLPNACDGVTLADTLTHVQVRRRLLARGSHTLDLSTERLASSLMISLDELAVALVAGDGGIEATAAALGVLPRTVRERISTLTSAERRHLSRLTEAFRRGCGGRVMSARQRIAAAGLKLAS